MDRRERLRTLWIALPFALVFPVVLGVLLAYCDSLPRSDSQMSASVMFVASAAAALLILAAVVHRAWPRVGPAAALGGLAWAPAMAFGDAHALERTMIFGDEPAMGMTWDLRVVVPLVVFLVIGIVIGLSAVGADRGRDRAVYRIGWCAVMLGGMVVTLALAKAGRSDPDTYFESLEVYATLQEGESIRLGGHDVRYDRGPLSGGHHDCIVAGVGFARPLAFIHVDESCPPINVRLDPRGDLAVAHRADVPPWAYPPELAFRVPTGRPVRISASTLSGRVAAPIAWRIGGVGSVLFGVLLLGAAARLRRRAASLSGRDAHHDGGGFVVFGDGPRVLLPVAAALPVGAVTLFDEVERPATYRDVPGPSFRAARAGSVGARRTALRDFAASLAAIALTIVVIGVTPLVVAGAYGI